MSPEKKAKLIYTIEYLVISVVFLVLGGLELLKVIELSENFRLIFKIITLIGAAIMIGDFIWIMVDKNRAKRNSVLDKAMMLPLAVYLIVFDIIGFVSERPYDYYQIGVPIAFFYIACAYIFQGIYHYYKPLPFLLEEIEKEKEIKAQEVIDQPVEDINTTPQYGEDENKEVNKDE